MVRENITWGEERIADELSLKLGIWVSPRTVRKYWPRQPRDPGRRRTSSQGIRSLDLGLRRRSIGPKDEPLGSPFLPLERIIEKALPAPFPIKPTQNPRPTSHEKFGTQERKIRDPARPEMPMPSNRPDPKAIIRPGEAP